MKIKAKQYRQFQIEIRGTDNGNHIENISLSSETPCLRWYGNEILLHNKENIDFERAEPNGLSMLVCHDNSKLPIGRWKNIHIDKATKKLVADPYFSGRQEPQEIMRDVLDGIITDVSIGYEILECQIERSTDKNIPDTVFVTKWKPLEASLVPIGADPNAGIGRGLDEGPEIEIPDPEPEEEAGQGTEDQVEGQVEQEATEEAPIQAEEEPVATPDETVSASEPEPEPEAEEPEKESENEPEKVVSGQEERSKEENKGISELQNDELLALRNTAVKLQLKTAEEADIIIRQCNNIEQARELILGSNQKDIYQKENKMSNNEILLRSIFEAAKGNFEGIEEAGKGLITNLGNRSFKADILNMNARANEMTSAAKGTDAIYDMNIGFLDILRYNTVILKAGASVRNAEYGAAPSYVRLKTSVTPALRAENPGATTSNTYAEVERVSYTPKAMTAKVYLTDELQKQSAFDLVAKLKTDMVSQFAYFVDKYALIGNASPAVVGLTSATSGIQDADLTSAAKPTFATVNALKTKVAKYAVDPSQCSYIMTTDLLGLLESTAKFTNGSVGIAEAGKINGFNTFASENCPIATANHTAIFGWFPQLEVMFYGPMEFSIDTQTRFDEGITILTARQYFDIGILQPNAFAATSNFLIA